MKKDYSHILIRPHITEKAAAQSDRSVYVFTVVKSATKTDVAHAVESLYKVKPTTVRVVTIPAKNVFVRGKKGTSKGYKKAYVQLKKGQTIEVI